MVIGILIILVVAVGTIIWLQKQGKIKDSDGDYIPDSIEDTVEDIETIFEEVKTRAKRVKEEIKDVAGEVKDVVEAVEDVVEAAKGSKRRGRPKKQK
mgnify:CR=1 FL=1|jgi:F0F1-type ATP synthase membrane subunit b/b'|tara:strand:+ start:444 stop:734 length:291 start_codon:yes stop_codon:yes gene_type:complete